MAPNVVPEVPSSRSQPTKNLRNPLPLSATQEQEVRKLYYARVRAQCADEIKEFAQCAKGRMFSVSWACKTQQFNMNSCMLAHATYAEEDAAREEWFAGVADRKRKKEEEAAAVEARRMRLIELTVKEEEREKAEAEAKRKQQEASKAGKGWRR